MGGTAIVREKTVLGTIEGLHDSLGEASLREFMRFNDRAKTEVSPRQFYDSTSTSHINSGHTSLEEERLYHRFIIFRVKQRTISSNIFIVILPQSLLRPAIDTG